MRQVRAFQHIRVNAVANQYLDVARAIAALLVMVGHVRMLFLVDIAQLSGLSRILALPLYALTSFGHEAVMIFFVLSGYLVGSSVLRSHQLGMWSWTEYLLRRLTRLWIVLLPGLILTVICDRIGASGPGSHLYSSIWHDHQVIGWRIIDRDGLGVLAGNLAFLQGIAVSTFGSNGPLWSLSYEFWYYVLFPIAVSAVAGFSTSVPRRLCAAVLATGGLMIAGRSITLYFSIWLLGVALWWGHDRLPNIARTPRATLVFIVGFITVAGLFRALHGSQFALDMVEALMATGALAGVLRPSVGPTTRVLVPLVALASMSYTLYVVHLPFLVLVRALWLGDERWPVGPAGILGAIAISGVTLVYAAIIAALTERQTERVRRWIRRALAEFLEHRRARPGGQALPPAP